MIRCGTMVEFFVNDAASAHSGAVADFFMSELDCVTPKMRFDIGENKLIHGMRCARCKSNSTFSIIHATCRACSSTDGADPFCIMWFLNTRMGAYVLLHCTSSAKEDVRALIIVFSTTCLRNHYLALRCRS